jgi:hypothetical protein
VLPGERRPEWCGSVRCWIRDDHAVSIRARTEYIPAGHLRDAIIGASLITAAQALDGLSLPVLWKRGGITGMIRHIADKWTYSCRAG